MTDNEIIKALEYCSSEHIPCSRECPGWKFDCETEKYALDLITRQQAEIERLQTVIFKKEDIMQLLHEEHQQTVDELQKANAILEEIENTINPLPFVTDFDIAIRNAKSEAIKEFAERLKASQIITHRSKEGFCVYEFDDELIDSLVEEMTVNYESSKQRRDEGKNGKTTM